LIPIKSVLFIPVSSPSGIGEYMRSMIIANALKKQWPDVKIHFILNKQVNYFSSCPYTVHSCDNSPTKAVKVVNSIITMIRPDLVIFDASGRAKQFAQAKAVGAKVAFISQHNKKRDRGLKLNRLVNTDIHWVAQPDYCMKPLSFWQRAKLNFFNKLPPKNIGTVFELENKKYQQQLLQRFNLEPRQYILFNAGSGGHLVNQGLAALLYFEVAQIIATQYSIKCIMVFGDNYPVEIPSSNDVICIKTTTNPDFISLLANAMMCVISAGDTLLQCIALQKLCVAAAVSPDQPNRLKLCQDQQWVQPAEANKQNLITQIEMLLNDKKSRINEKLLFNYHTDNGLETIKKDIDLLFKSSH
jgi:hypothetical protein